MSDNDDDRMIKREETDTDAAACGDGDLDGVSTRSADVFERQRPVKEALVGRSSERPWSLDHERSSVDADRHRDGPVGRHL